MPASSEILNLVKISRWAGSDLLLAQGAGGNTSVKSPDGKKMWIKASGLRLSQVSKSRGYVETDLPALKSLIATDRPPSERKELHEEFIRGMNKAILRGQLRPSLETGVHIPLGRAVLHTHPVYLNAFSCMEGGQDVFRYCWKRPTAWAPYAPPGYALGKSVETIAKQFESKTGNVPPVVVLENHGLITSGKSVNEAMTLTREVVRCGRNYFGDIPKKSLEKAKATAEFVRAAKTLERGLKKRFGGIFLAQPTVRPVLLQALRSAPTFLMAGPLIPDDVVFCNDRYRVSWSDGPERWVESLGRPAPKVMILFIDDVGIIFAGRSASLIESAEENLLTHFLTRTLIDRRGRARTLPQVEIDYLAGMESEKYRQSISHK